MEEQSERPKKSPSFPPGIPYIVGNEAAERFSYYGMKSILVVFMISHIQDSSGAFAPMSEAEAKTWYHAFGTANYLFPILGALLADIFFGKYKTIIWLSVVYCLGHFVLAIDATRFGLVLGLGLIALGSGGIKPCVSAHVGDQFRPEAASLVEKAFSYFYFSINLGAFVSTLLTPYLLSSFGPHVAFGVPGILMFIATIVFWMGRNVFVAIPPVPAKKYFQDLKSKEGLKALGSLSLMYVFISAFWSLFDQTGSSWVIQAGKLDLKVKLDLLGLNFELLPSQIQALNPVLIMLLIPVFSFLIYPFVNRFFAFTALRKVAVGMVVAALSFVIVAYTERLILTGESVSILWQMFAYVVLTAAEVMVSVTALEFSYTQAPKSMKSLVMGLFFLSVALGNAFTALVNYFLQFEWLSSYLEGANYFLFFAGLMFVVSILFYLFSLTYQEELYLHD